VTYRQRVRRAVDALRLPVFRLANRDKATFTCPVCRYSGPFRDVDAPTGRRRHAKCPRCGALERHRAQWLVFERLFAQLDTRSAAMLHFAPEPFFETRLPPRFGRYETADLDAPGVDHHVDLQKLPFDDASWDLVFASHVLEHVPDDDRALAEVRRILRPGGVAILPVPVVGVRTVEYHAPNPAEFGHVRAPGLDYFDRYERHFTRVERIGSDRLPEACQPYVYEDRTRWPTPECPLRVPMPGERHVDVVPLCHA